MNRSRLLIGVSIGAAIVVIVLVVIIGGLVSKDSAVRSEDSQRPSQEATTMLEPDDPIAAEGGPGKALVLTNWDAPIGRGGTASGVMDPESQNAAVAAIQADYRARHADAPEKLSGAIRDAKFDAGPQILSFTVVVDRDRYVVRYNSDKETQTITGPSGRELRK